MRFRCPRRTDAGGGASSFPSPFVTSELAWPAPRRQVVWCCHTPPFFKSSITFDSVESVHIATPRAFNQTNGAHNGALTAPRDALTSRSPPNLMAHCVLTTLLKRRRAGCRRRLHVPPRCVFASAGDDKAANATAPTSIDPKSHPTQRRAEATESIDRARASHVAVREGPHVRVCEKREGGRALLIIEVAVRPPKTSGGRSEAVGIGRRLDGSTYVCS